VARTYRRTGLAPTRTSMVSSRLFSKNERMVDALVSVQSARGAQPNVTWRTAPIGEPPAYAHVTVAG
jgi:hypothetical protein